MSEREEQQNLTWLEAWQEPPAFLEADTRTACYAGVATADSHGFESMMFAIVGCGIGMLVMGVIAIGYLQGLLAGAKALRSDSPASGLFRSAPPPATKAANELGAVIMDGTRRAKR